MNLTKTLLHKVYCITCGIYFRNNLNVDFLYMGPSRTSIFTYFKTYVSTQRPLSRPPESFIAFSGSRGAILNLVIIIIIIIINIRYIISDGQVVLIFNNVFKLEYL